MNKKNFKFLLKSLIIFTVFLFPSLVKATTLEELKQQFINLGGSNEGFNKIIQVVEKSQASNRQLKNKINEVYNKQLYDLMSADNFDYKAYIQTYNNLEKEKYNLMNQNLNDMVSLLNSLSLTDRRAYASLLYNVSATKNMSTPKDSSINTSTSSNMTSNQTMNIPNNTNAYSSNTIEQQNIPNNTTSNNDVRIGDNNVNNNPPYNAQTSNMSSEYLNNEEKGIQQQMTNNNNQVQNYQYNYNNMMDNNG